MTLLVILITAILGALWLPANGPYIIGTLDVFDTIFFAGLASAVIAAIVSGSRPNLIAGTVLIANFILSRLVWRDSDPVATAALLDIATAAYFAYFGTTRWETAIGALFLLSAGAALLTFLGIVPSHLERPAGALIAFSHPDLATNLGHLANVILGAGSGDWGKLLRITDRLRVRVPWAREEALMRRVL